MCERCAVVEWTPPAGSRRRRLWELPTQAHCPVIGVCLPLRVLRRLADKVLGGQVLADDYALHCGAIAESTRRTPMSERLQRELEARFVAAVRQAGAAKSAGALLQWWQDHAQGSEVAGALWATLTHPRCDARVEEQVLHDVHMLQHQLGTAQRVDAHKLAELAHEHGVLARELGAVQQRCTTLLHDKSRALERAQQRLVDLERRLTQATQDAERERRRADEAEAAARATAAPVAAAAPADPRAAPAPLDARAVLCVGGRTTAVPVYRRTVEALGARFLHHDGGDENSVHQLDASLIAADLVVCQTGCISHDAYWRVKDHCKRTGKRCVFVDNPSGSRLRSALDVLVK